MRVNLLRIREQLRSCINLHIDNDLDYGGLPSDHYLWLTGQGTRLLRGQVPPQSTLPKRTP